MKELGELSFPEEVRYSEDHEYARQVGGEKVRVGISDYAQDQLGDIVFVEMPEVGAVFQKARCVERWNRSKRLLSCISR